MENDNSINFKSDSTYVALLDILGFKDMIYNNSHETLDRIYSDVFSLAVGLGTSLGAYTKTTSQNGGEIITPHRKLAIVHSLIISDSIIFWTEDNSSDSLNRIIYAVRMLLVKSFLGKLPLRGCITCGPLSVINKTHPSKRTNIESTVYGKSIVTAYKNANNQEWAGCVIDELCEQQGLLCSREISDVGSIFNGFVTTYMISRYKVPYKEGPIKKEYAVDWTSGGDVYMGTIRNSFKSYNKETNEWAVQRKLNNTLQFFCDMQNPEFDRYGES